EAPVVAASRPKGITLMTSTTQTTFRDVYSRITDKLLPDLEQGVRPWHKPGSADPAAGKITRPLRHNGVPYKGINVVMLWSASVTKGYACPLWLTFGRRPNSAAMSARAKRVSSWSM